MGLKRLSRLLSPAAHEEDWSVSIVLSATRGNYELAYGGLTVYGIILLRVIQAGLGFIHENCSMSRTCLLRTAVTLLEKTGNFLSKCIMSWSG